MRALIVSMMFATVCPAQTTWTVGTPSLPTIQAGINAAGPGDVIVVLGGSYPGFTVDKGVHIRADWGATVDLQFQAFVPTDVVFAIPPGQVATIQGIRLRTSIFPVFDTGGADVLPGSTVVFEDCALFGARRSGGRYNSALWCDRANVALIRCVVEGKLPNGEGLAARSSTVVAHDTTFVGGGLSWDHVGDAGAAVSVINSRFHAGHSVLRGGHHLGPFNGLAWNPGPGLESAQSDVWLSDCTVIGGDNNGGGRGGHGVVNLTPTAVRLARTAVTPGRGSLPGAMATVGNVLAAEPLLGIELSAPLRSGATATVTMIAAPRTFVALFAALDPEVRHLRDTVQPVWLLGFPSFPVVVSGRTNANGRFALAVPVPPQLALQGHRLLMQGAAFAAYPLQLSPLAGSTVR